GPFPSAPARLSEASSTLDEWLVLGMTADDDVHVPTAGDDLEPLRPRPIEGAADQLVAHTLTTQPGVPVGAQEIHHAAAGRGVDQMALLVRGARDEALAPWLVHQLDVHVASSAKSRPDIAPDRAEVVYQPEPGPVHP